MHEKEDREHNFCEIIFCSDSVSAKTKKCEKDNFFVKESSFRFLAELFVCILDYITTITMYTCMQCTFVNNKMITIFVQLSAVQLEQNTELQLHHSATKVTNIC